MNGCPKVTRCQLTSSEPRNNGDLLNVLDETEAAWAACADKVDTIVMCQERTNEQATIFTPRTE